MLHHLIVARRSPLMGMLLLILALGLTACGPKRVRMSVSPSEDPALGSVAPFPHELYADVLRAAANPNTGEFDFALVAAAHLPALERYLAEASAATPEVWPASDQKAFWINTHNAAALHLIASDWEAFASGRRALRTSMFTPDPGYRIAGRWYSLADLRRHLLRRHEDPRMLYALAWGAAGAPDFVGLPVHAATLELDLAEARDRYIASGRGLRVEGGTLIVEGLFALYSEELLAGDDPLVIARQHLGESALRGVTEVERRRFDWTFRP